MTSLSPAEQGPSISLSKLSDKVKKKLESTRKVKNTKKKPVDNELREGLDLLGGTEEDLQLIDGFDDDETEEINGPKESKKDKKLGSEVAEFISGLGLEGLPVDEPDEIDEKENVKESVQNEKKSDNKSQKNEADEKLKQKRDKRKEKREKLKQKKDEARESQKLKNQVTENLKKQENMLSSLDSDNLHVDSSIEWYKQNDSTASSVKLTSSEISILFNTANDLLKQECSNYVYQDSKSTSQKQFMSQLLSAGTLSDKISALTLLIQESPLHSMKHLDTLLGLCSKKSKGSAMQAVAALKDLLVAGVLPDRKLVWFKDQPLSKNATKRQLILYAFEDYLKNYYFKLIQQLEQLSHDTVAYIRSQSVLHILALLQSKPEQEVNLLRLGVNKLGDLDKKIASRVSYLLLQLEQAHPGMKLYIVNAISELIFRPGSTYHAQYYSVITLNQTILAHKDVETANSLVKTYLQMFEKLLVEWNRQKPVKKGEQPTEKIKKPRWNKKGNKGKHGGERQLAKTDEEVAEQQASKLQGAILSGLNRAYPFAHIGTDVFDKHIDALYRGAHSSNFNTTIQALIFLYQLAKSEKSYTDRYYRTLYATLQDPKLVQSSKLRLYLNILFKSIRDDTEHPGRMMAFAKRILQTTAHWGNNGAATGMIYLMIQVCKTLPFLREVMFDVTEETADSDAYDGRQRNPLFAKAELTKVWEIIPLLNHFHPTVAYYAEGLVKAEDSSDLSKPDLELHTLIHFLDKFVNKNPKQKAAVKGTSIMQPSAAVDQASSIVGVNVPGAAINSYDWSKVDFSKVNVEDRFFYHYFANRKEVQPKEKKDVHGELDIEEGEVWDAIMHSQPDLEGELSDGDVDLDDLDDESGFEGFTDEEDIDEEESDQEEANEEDANDSEIADDIEENKNISSHNSDDESEELSMNDLDDEDLVDSDEDITISNKRSAIDHNETKKSKRRKLKDLPVFASAEDYAEYLESDDEE